MGQHELKFVHEAFDTNWIAPVGPHVDAFEKELAQTVNSPHAVALSSGTAALHLALKIQGIKAGDEVFCSTLTFSASVNPIIYEGGIPVFIDSERSSWNLDPARLHEALETKARLGKLPKALIVVHLYGQSADLDPIVELCARFDVPLIEDAAEALGSTYRGSAPGTKGRFGIYSFNGNKIITTSSGGALVTPEGALAEKARFLSQQARDPAPHYQHSEIGYNYRMSNVLAGIGRGQLRVLQDRVDARRAVCAFYKNALADLPGLEFMPEASWGLCTRWLTCILIDPKQAGIGREDLRLALAAENIEGRPIWKPMHQQPVFAAYERFGGEVSDDIFERGLCLPSGSNLPEEDLQRVVQVIRKCWRSAGSIIRV
jgi:dTDP-4-amino-4,6-dideoxygalactose transaminase